MEIQKSICDYCGIEDESFDMWLNHETSGKGIFCVDCADKVAPAVWNSNGTWRREFGSPIKKENGYYNITALNFLYPNFTKYFHGKKGIASKGEIRRFLNQGAITFYSNNERYKPGANDYLKCPIGKIVFFEGKKSQRTL